MVGKNNLPISGKKSNVGWTLDKCDGSSFKLLKLKIWMQNYFSGVSANANRRSTSGSADGRYLIKKRWK